MSVSLSEIADALRWLWIFCGIVWLAYAWLHRVAYTRALLGVLALVGLDWLLHVFADFAEQPNSNIPSDFALYSVIMLLAGMVGLGAACLFARWRGMNMLTMIDAALVGVIAGGIGGRAYHVWLNWDYYVENPDLITELAHGGFGIRGALVVGFLAVFLFALVTHNSFWKLADAAAIGVTLAQSIGWYGAALTHTHYGIALDAPPPSGMFAALASVIRNFGYNFAQALPDAYNLIAFRIPLQMFAALFFLALFVVLLLRARANPQSGAVFVAYWIAVSLAHFLFGFWRGEETWVWNTLRIDQWFDLLSLLFALAFALLHAARGNVSSRRMLQHA